MVLKLFMMFALTLSASLSVAAEWRVTPDGEPLQAVLDAAPEGARIIVSPGVYTGNFRITKTVELIGEPGAILDGDGRGRILHVAAPGTSIKGLHLRNGGADLTDMDTALFVDRVSIGILIEDNRIEARGFGMWLDSAREAKVIRNRISGDTSIRSVDRGNGIHLFDVRESEIIENEVWDTRDGIYIDISNHNRLVGNYLHSQRYGIHYMFSQHNEVLNNISRNNRLGFALMQSRYLTVIGNVSDGDQNYGFLLNFIVDSVLAENVSINAQRGGTPGAPDGHGISGAEGKALFIYNALFNDIRDNLFANTEIGIHLTAGSENNTFHGNAFIGNQTQVKYVANRQQEWSHEGRGNYWSDYLGWDLSGDGVGDIPYEPNDSVDKLIWTYPLAKVLMNSPAVQVLRWVQREFPILRPAGVRDSHPIMRPPDQFLEMLK